MKLRSGIFILIIMAMVITLQSCADCDNCQVSPAPKQVKIVNSADDDLVFGPGSVYNPDDIEIKNDLGETVEFFPNVDNGSIDFTFNVNSATYFLILNSTDTDTISFVYGKDKQVDCCNEFDVTVATTVNNKMTNNDDRITIVK